MYKDQYQVNGIKTAQHLLQWIEENLMKTNQIGRFMLAFFRDTTLLKNI